MRQYKFSSHLLFLTIVAAIGLVTSACSSGTPSNTSNESTTPARIQSSTVAPQAMRTMRVDVGGYRLFVQCMGQGSPTVVLEAGLGDDVSIRNIFISTKIVVK